MKILSWNCRGLGNPATVRAMKKILYENKPDIVFLMETKLTAMEMQRLNMSRFGYKGCFPVDCAGMARCRHGGICMLWSDNMELELQSFFLNNVMFKINKEDTDTEWFCLGIYGWPERGAKYKTWQLLEEIKRNGAEKWLCMGDYNEILWSEDKKGGAMCDWRSMEQFRDVIQECRLHDLGYTGNRYTWTTNGRTRAENIRERLDRMFANQRWKDEFPNYKVVHMPRYKSDHAAIMLDSDANGGDTKRRCHFGFHLEHMWLHHTDFGNILKESWIETHSESSLIKKLEKCGTSLANWVARNFGSVRKKKRELTERLAELQRLEQSEVVKSQLQKLEGELDEILKLEETMWFQRSKAFWIKDGDRNSSFFHQKASNRRRRNTIKYVKNEEGEEMKKQEEIEEVMRTYFVNIFTSEAGGDMTNVLTALEGKVTEDMNEVLMKPFTAEEVQKAFKQMHPSKAPGPDGMSPFFYQHFWSVVKNDVLKEVLNILNHGQDPTSLNHTHVVLIPKIKKPQTPKDFRPISLCNVVFRALTKTIANRVKTILPSIIYESQSAFLPGRAITDNAMIAFEIFHSMKNKTNGRKGFMAMKLDMSKAYDRVEWNFLEVVMSKLGLCTSWVALIMRCVRTVSYAIMVNGSPSASFCPERGLRQAVADPGFLTWGWQK